MVRVQVRLRLRTRRRYVERSVWMRCLRRHLTRSLRVAIMGQVRRMQCTMLPS